jgi:hypothetical protein
MTDRLTAYAQLAAAAAGLRAERDRLIGDLYRAGYGVSAIADAAGLSRRAVYDILEAPGSGQPCPYCGPGDCHGPRTAKGADIDRYYRYHPCGRPGCCGNTPEERNTTL